MATKDEEFKNARNSIVLIKQQIIKPPRDINLEIASINEMNRNEMEMRTIKSLNHRNGSIKDKENSDLSDSQKIQFNNRRGGTINDSTENTDFNGKKPLRSILKKSKFFQKNQSPQQFNTSNRIRSDATGSIIQAGSKKHKITFREKVHDITIVENWKEYNMENYEPSKCDCRSCNIF